MGAVSGMAKVVGDGEGCLGCPRQVITGTARVIIAPDPCLKDQSTSGLTADQKLCLRTAHSRAIIECFKKYPDWVRRMRTGTKMASDAQRKETILQAELKVKFAHIFGTRQTRIDRLVMKLEANYDVAERACAEMQPGEERLKVRRRMQWWKAMKVVLQGLVGAATSKSGIDDSDSDGDVGGDGDDIDDRKAKARAMQQALSFLMNRQLRHAFQRQAPWGQQRPL